MLFLSLMKMFPRLHPDEEMGMDTPARTNPTLTIKQTSNLTGYKTILKGSEEVKTVFKTERRKKNPGVILKAIYI